MIFTIEQKEALIEILANQELETLQSISTQTLQIIHAVPYFLPTPRRGEEEFIFGITDNLANEIQWLRSQAMIAFRGKLTND